MKFLFLSFSFLVSLLVIDSEKSDFTQSKKEIITCHPALTGDDMAVFANDPAFIAMHLSPLPIQYDAQGEEVSFPGCRWQGCKGLFDQSKKQIR